MISDESTMNYYIIGEFQSGQRWKYGHPTNKSIEFVSNEARLASIEFPDTVFHVVNSRMEYVLSYSNGRAS